MAVLERLRESQRRAPARIRREDEPLCVIARVAFEYAWVRRCQSGEASS